MSNFKCQISNVRRACKQARYTSFHYWKFSIPASQKGFTLVELLVVIAIIGVLSALLTSNFIAVRQRARDTQRKSDLRQIQSALELYRADVGSYPSSITCGNALTNPNTPTTVYMSKIPCDPLSSQTYNSGSYSYAAANPPSSYNLVACLENYNDNDSSTQGSDVTGASGSCPSKKYFTVTNP